MNKIGLYALADKDLMEKRSLRSGVSLRSITRVQAKYATTRNVSFIGAFGFLFGALWLESGYLQQYRLVVLLLAHLYCLAAKFGCYYHQCQTRSPVIEYLFFPFGAAWPGLLCLCARMGGCPIGRDCPTALPLYSAPSAIG